MSAEIYMEVFWFLIFDAYRDAPEASDGGFSLQTLQTKCGCVLLRLILYFKSAGCYVWSRCTVDCRNALDFCIISWSSLGFSVNFQLARSSTRLNLCTSSQSSPSCSSSIRTALIWSINKAHTRSCSMLRYFAVKTLNWRGSRCTLRWRIGSREMRQTRP